MGASPPGAWQRALPRIWLSRGPMAWLLWPVSLLYGALAGLRRALYRWHWLDTHRVPVPVIVVGNVIAGGSGKTPVVMALVRHLQAQGWRVGVISRGYGRQSTDTREVKPDSAVADVGDEPALIQHATGAPVFVAARRLDAARQLLATYPDTQLILCDDGLQHYSLHRDLNICVFDNRGVGNGWLLPAGPLREPWPRPVDLVLHTGSRPAFDGFTAQRALSPCALRADGTRVNLAQWTAQNTQPLLAVAAIANPHDFFDMLRAQGLTLAQTLALPDHYSFDSWLPSAHKGYTVICTEKDAVKLWRHQADALAVPLVLTPEAAFFNQLDAQLARHRAPPIHPSRSPCHGHTTS